MNIGPIEKTHEDLHGEERTPVIGEVWFRRGRVPGFGTDRQRLAWAKANEGIDLHCQILQRVERKGVACVDFFWDVPPEWLNDEAHNLVRPLAVPGLYTQPLDKFLLEWEPMTR